MSGFEARVEVQLRPGIADPQGATIERALPALGFSGVSGVRAGKAFRLSVEAPDAQAAEQLVQQLCARLLQPGHRGRLDHDKAGGGWLAAIALGRRPRSVGQPRRVAWGEEVKVAQRVGRSRVPGHQLRARRCRSARWPRCQS